MAKNRLVALRASIKRSLLAEADPTYLASIRALVPTKAPVMGVRVPAIRKEVRKFVAEHATLSYTQAIALTEMAFQDKVREEILFNIFLLARYKNFFKIKLWPKIDHWVACIENWEVCDQLAANISGYVLEKNLNLVDDLLQWVRSPNLWRRRFALASACVLNQRGRKFPDQTLRVCAEVMDDPEIIVQKALGWALREASKNAPEDVFAFLMTWKGKVPKRVMKHASQKLNDAQVTMLLA